MPIDLQIINKYIVSKFFTKTTLALPQNMTKNSRPAKLLRNYNLSKNDLTWYYDKETHQYVGFLLSHEALSKPNIKSWVSSRKVYKVAPGKHYNLYIN